jgi:hypothetical protein
VEPFPDTEDGIHVSYVWLDGSLHEPFACGENNPVGQVLLSDKGPLVTLGPPQVRNIDAKSSHSRRWRTFCRRKSLVGLVHERAPACDVEPVERVYPRNVEDFVYALVRLTIVILIVNKDVDRLRI